MAESHTHTGLHTDQSFMMHLDNVPRATHERNAELAEQVQQDGDSDAMRELAETNLRLAVHVANRYPVSEHTTRDDLIQAGAIGLMKAVVRYDPRRGALSTYARDRVINAIGREVDGSTIIHVPVNRAAEARRAWRRAKGDESQTPEGERHNWAMLQTESLSMPVGKIHEGTQTLGDTIVAAEVDDPVGDYIEEDAVRSAVDGLEEPLNEIVRLRFWGQEGGLMPYYAIAAQLGMKSRDVACMLDTAKIELAKMLRD